MNLIKVLILAVTCLAATHNVEVDKPTSVDWNVVKSKEIDLSTTFDDGVLAYAFVREEHEPRKIIWKKYDAGTSAIVKIFNDALASVDARNMTIEVARAYVGRVRDVRWNTFLGMKPENDMLSPWAVSHIWSSFRITQGEFDGKAHELYVLLGKV